MKCPDCGQEMRVIGTYWVCENASNHDSGEKVRMFMSTPEHERCLNCGYGCSLPSEHKDGCIPWHGPGCPARMGEMVFYEGVTTQKEDGEMLLDIVDPRELDY